MHRQHADDAMRRTWLAVCAAQFLRGNAQADVWALGPDSLRRCPEDEALTVSEAFAQERERLLALPGDAFPTDEIKAVSAGKRRTCGLISVSMTTRSRTPVSRAP